MYYNFKDEDLKSDQKIEEYKEFAKEVLENIEAVKEVYKKLREFNDTASITSKIGVLEYKNTLNRKEPNIYASGEVYSADRLRQVIYASQRGKKLVMNARYQEGTGLESDPFIDVADISFEYDPATQEIYLGEVLNTQELTDMYQDMKSTNQQNKKRKAIGEEER